MATIYSNYIIRVTAIERPLIVQYYCFTEPSRNKFKPRLFGPSISNLCFVVVTEHHGRTFKKFVFNI